MPIPGVNAKFVQDEPLSSDDFNALVDGSVNLANAWPAEHDDQGRHVPTRFEKGVVLFEWSGASYYVLDHHGPLSADVQPHFGGWLLTVTLDEPYPDPLLWGLLATPGRETYYENQMIAEDLDTKTATFAGVWIRADVSPRPREILVRVLGVPK